MDTAAARPRPRANLGSFPNEAAVLQALVDRMVAQLQPFRIYLSGSRADGTAAADSDFDILVVFDDRAPNSDIDYDAVYSPLMGFGVGCDVVPCRASELKEVLSDPTNPWSLTWAKARKLYERA